MKSFVLGFDTSTTCVGWALLSLTYAQDQDIRFGKIIPPKLGKNQGTWFQRATYIYAEVEKVLLSAPISAVAIEELNSMRSGETTRQLAGINMGIQFLVYKHLGLEPSAMYTSTIKKDFAGAGNAQKWHMIARANELYGLELQWPSTAGTQKNKKLNDEDIADAIGAAYCLEKEVGDELRATLNKGE